MFFVVIKYIKHIFALPLHKLLPTAPNHDLTPPTGLSVSTNTLSVPAEHLLMFTLNHLHVTTVQYYG